MNHDLIMNAHDEEKIRLEEQASQVAQRAAEALRQSRMVRSHDSKASNELPNKGTNKINGFAAAGASAGKALSSAELLAQIRGNQEKAIGAGLEHQFGVSSSSTNQPRSGDVRSSRATENSSVQPEVLIRKICTFIQQRGGSSDSASIVQYFKDRIPSKDLALFKNLLKEIATLHKGSNGSYWVLKPDYQF